MKDSSRRYQILPFYLGKTDKNLFQSILSLLVVKARDKRQFHISGNFVKINSLVISRWTDMVKGISTRNLEREKYLMTCSNNARAPMKAVKVVFLSNACSGQGFDLKLNWKWSLRDVVKSCLFHFGKINKKLIPVCSVLLVKRQFLFLETWK